MTKHDPPRPSVVGDDPDPRCRWCHRPLSVRPGPGRRRRYCSQAHRQRAYEARRRADALDVPEGQVVVSEAELRRVHDRLYRLEAAVEDVTSDLRTSSTRDELRAAVEHLLDAAGDLVGLVIEPATT